MHQMILATPGISNTRIVVDHIDGNGLNNTRGNLRLCTIAENLHGIMRGPRGRSRYRGVSWHSATGKWEARISVRGKRISLGLFSSEEDAAIAYDMAKTREFGPDYELNRIS